MNKLIVAVLLSFSFLWAGAQSQREKVLLNQDWRFAKGHAANPEKDFNYGRALSFSKIAFHLELLLTVVERHRPVVGQGDGIPFTVVELLGVGDAGARLLVRSNSR